MKEQIEEMAKDLGIAFQLAGTTHFGAVAEVLVNAGYRKQKEGEWLIPASGEPWEGNSFGLCSRCGKVDDGFIKKAHKHCPQLRSENERR